MDRYADRVSTPATARDVDTADSAVKPNHVSIDPPLSGEDTAARVINRSGLPTINDARLQRSSAITRSTLPMHSVFAGRRPEERLCPMATEFTVTTMETATTDIPVRLTSARPRSAAAPITAVVDPVTLPMPEHPLTGRCGHGVHGAVRPAAYPVGTTEHVRFRWFLGHQAAFCIWRLLTDRLRAALAQADASIPGAALARLFDVYSVLLLYSGSCSAETYHATIRPEMMAADPAFSGRWARDYESLPILLRAVRSAYPSRTTTLAASAKVNLMVHRLIAQELVPDGPSLLREARGRQTVAPASDAERDLFDRYFLVHRCAISRPALIEQLVTRLNTIIADLRTAPLPSGDDPPQVLRLRRDSVAILAETATALASGETS